MALLEVRDIHTRYGAIEALKGISLTVDAGEVVTLIGSNGAGKTTTLRSISGLTPASSGTITFAGEDITHVPANEIVGRGIALAPEGRHIFPRMTVLENLELGAHRRRDPGIAAEFDRVYELFPVLKERQRQKAGTMSGGEQQMLAIGRALMAEPKLLMLDEPSLGIAPLLVQRIYATIAEINISGVAILLVEQNANYALDAASRGYVLETGRVALANDSASLRDDPEVQNAYLGTLLTGINLLNTESDRHRNNWRQGAVSPVRVAHLRGRRGVAGGSQGLRRARRADAGPAAVGRGSADHARVARAPGLEVEGPGLAAAAAASGGAGTRPWGSYPSRAMTWSAWLITAGSCVAQITVWPSW